MRTTLEMPDELLTRAKQRAEREGLTMKMFFILAVEEKLADAPLKPRLEPPTLRTGGLTFNVTREQIDEAMFGQDS